MIADLTAAEIVEQLVHAAEATPIRNVVFMGMGEPLNNYAAVREAVALMTDSTTFALRRRAVTVSTVVGCILNNAKKRNAQGGIHM